MSEKSSVKRTIEKIKDEIRQANAAVKIEELARATRVSGSGKLDVKTVHVEPKTKGEPREG